MPTAPDVALLAPVPLKHLQTGKEKAAIKGWVAFGSRLENLFKELDHLRKGMAVDVFIYTSHANGSHEPKITWSALYTGYVRDEAGVHPAKMRYRPESTVTDTPDWHIFWNVQELKELPPSQYILIKTLTACGQKIPFNGLFYPKGPQLIKHPLKKF